MSPDGAVIMSIFAAVWWLVGTKVSGHGSVLMYGIPILMTSLVLLVALRLRSVNLASPEENARRGRLVGIASGAEGLLIFLAVNILANTGTREFTAPVISIIVGLHFIPLAKWLPVQLYYASAALLVAAGVAGFWVHDEHIRTFYVSVVAACILWLTSVIVLRNARDLVVAPNSTGHRESTEGA
jgi:hypothetical protein